MPMPLKADPIKYCTTCNQKMVRKRINGRMEDRAVFLRRKYCDQICMARGQHKPDPTRSAYLKRIRHLLKESCEQCGTSSKRLTLHHKNRNWRNNEPSNIQTLCSTCHTSLHHAAGEIVPRFVLKQCKLCGRMGCKRNTCDTCRTRSRRSGILSRILSENLV